MDFAFSPDQQLLRGAARAFLDEHVTPAVVRALWDDPRGERDDFWKEMARLGWLGLALPEAHGGSALGMVETAIVLEEMGRVACPGPYLETVVAARALQAAGTPAQQARWLPAIAGGAMRGTVAFLDAELDWRPEATATRAEPAPGGVRLSGVKQWVPSSRRASPEVSPCSWSRRARGVCPTHRCRRWIRACAGRR
jgi:alkylation response protein AidB-like acyl-CoA dehydrogenase